MKHALIVEDNALIAMMIQKHLTELGYDSSDIATTQAEAIRLAEYRCPDLITADDRLERGSGVQAVRHICRNIAIPVIFIVADPANIEAAFPNAISLLKPFSGASLAKAIRLAERTPMVTA